MWINKIFKHSGAGGYNNCFLIAGLGNPGKQYEDTRHNIGFKAIDLIEREFCIKVNKIKHRALIGEGILQERQVILAKPQTYMNLSGESVGALARYYKIPPERIVIVYDESALPVGALRIRAKGSSGGHNGMKSIISHLKTDEFSRIRIGIGAPEHEDYDLADYVLGKFNTHEAAEIGDILRLIPNALACIIQHGAAEAANRFNRNTNKG